MSKSMIEGAIECFNSQDIEGLSKYWHNDIKIYSLETNELWVSGKENVYELNKTACLDRNKNMIISNVVKHGNIEIVYKKFTHSDKHDITIMEFEEGLMKNVWHSSFPSNLLK